MRTIEFALARWPRLLLAALLVQTAVTVIITLTVVPFGAGWSRVAESFRSGWIIANAIMLVEACAWLALWKPVTRLAPTARRVAAIVVYSVAAHGGILIALLVPGVGGPGGGYWDRYWHQYFQQLTVLTVTAGVVAAVAGAVYDGLRYRARFEAAQARLQSLESRLRPHFLFNTLNSIRVLIAEDPAAAEDMVVRLSSLLRASLDVADHATVRLDRELELTISYLEIERTRFGDRFRYSVDVPADLRGAAVPPFALQTLVENSVKYGGVDIRVRARADSGRLLLEVWDSGPGFPVELAVKQGHGLDNLRARLLAIWGDRGSLEFSSDPPGTTVRVSHPLSLA
jgi:signal transduction histidine kinase